jgi:hypothetical protein
MFVNNEFIITMFLFMKHQYIAFLVVSFIFSLYF